MSPRKDSDNYFCYLPVSERDKLWQLYVTTVGTATIKPGAPYPYKADEHPASYTLNWAEGRVLNEFQFVYISHGSGRFRSFHGESMISAGTTLLLVPGERHWYKPEPDTGWTEYWIGFNGECVDAWLSRGFIDRNDCIYRPGVSQTLLSLFERAIGLSRKNPVCMQQLISSVVPQIMARLYASKKQAQAVPETENLFEQARVIFDDYIYKKFDLEVITTALSVSYYTLRDYFNQHSGMSPYHYFLQMKINKAKELLLDGEMSVKEVSYKLAFDSPYYFSRLFKKKTGVSPSKWNGADIQNDMELWSTDQ